MGKLLLGKYLLTEKNSLQENWGVAFDGCKIIAVDANELLKEKYREYELLDYRDKIIAPGLINSHLHTYSLLGRGITYPPEIKSFESFLKNFWWPSVEDRIDLNMIKTATQASAVELLNSGVTCFCDILEAPKAIPGALDTQAQVLEDVGIRAILSIEGSERLGSEHGQKLLDENEGFYLNSQNHPLISGMMCTHTTFTCSREYLKKASMIARKIGAPIQLHLSESAYEPRVCTERYGILPSELYQEIGFWGDDVLAAQGVKLEEKEIDILIDNHVALSHVPLSNCGFGAGIAPVPSMVEKGMTIGLGTDGYINNFFEVMRGAYLLHKGNLENAAVLPAKEVFSMATNNGSHTVHLAEIGRLKAGYFADIITIDANFPTPINDHNIFEQIILHRNPDDVKEVFINGRLIKEAGQLNKYNWSDIQEEVRSAAAKLWRFDK